MREELAGIIGFEMDDPRLAGVTVTGAEVSSDSRHARVKVLAEGGPVEQKQALTALDHARHYLRRELASRLSLRMAPELHFELDRWAGADNRIEILLKRAKKTRGRNENEV